MSVGRWIRLATSLSYVFMTIIGTGIRDVYEENKRLLDIYTLGWKCIWLSSPWSLIILTPPTHDIVTMTSHTRPSCFSASNIEKLGVAWGRG